MYKGCESTRLRHAAACRFSSNCTDKSSRISGNFLRIARISNATSYQDECVSVQHEFGGCEAFTAGIESAILLRPSPQYIATVSDAASKRFGMTVSVLVPSSICREAEDKREATRKLGYVARAATIFRPIAWSSIPIGMGKPGDLTAGSSASCCGTPQRPHTSATRRGDAGRTGVRGHLTAAPRHVTDRLRIYRFGVVKTRNRDRGRT